MEEMKGITRCGDCIHYNWKKHKCNLGCKDEGLATDHFYKDCPLPKVQPVNQWIPCSERLPDKNGSYLVSFREAITNSYGLCVKYWSGEEQRWRPCNYAPSVIWKAWMPLPPAFKGE